MSKKQIETVIIMIAIFVILTIITFTSKKNEHDTIVETNLKIKNLSKLSEMIKNKELSEAEFDYIVSNDKDLKKLKNTLFECVKKNN